MSQTKEAKIFFYVLFALITIGVFLFVRPYLPAALLSFLVGLVLYPLYRRLLKVSGNRTWLALLLSYLGLVLLLLIPLSLVALLTINVVRDFASQANTATFANGLSVPWLVDQVNHFLGRFPGVEATLTASQVTDRLQAVAQNLGSKIFQGSQSPLEFIPIIFISASIISAVLVHHQRIMEFIFKLSPLGDTIDRIYIGRMKAMTLSMIRGTFIVALVQGAITGILLWIAGVQYAAFLGLLATILSVIPLGAGIIAIPIGIALILTGNIWQGILQIAGNLIVVANVDNVLRPRLVDKTASLHPALVLIGLFAGLAQFGILGVVFGPVIMIAFVTTVEVYVRHFRSAAS